LFARLNKKTEDKKFALLDFIRLSLLCGKSNNKAMVVFDGYPDFLEKAAYKTDIDVVFSREETADERIKKIIEASPVPKNIVMVSDDKEIVFFAKSMGAKAMAAEELISRAPGARRYKPGQRKENQEQKEDLEPKISYSSMQKINQELRKIWLK